MDIDARIEALAKDLSESVAIGRRTDERLDRITARHEALANTVEMVELQIGKAEVQVAKAVTLVVQLAESMAALAKIVESHENRLTYLEGGSV